MEENVEYTLTIMERKQKANSFNLPQVPKRVAVTLVYTSQLNLIYGDVYELDFVGRMNSISFTHASFDINSLNMIGVRFDPMFTLPAASSTNPIT